MKREDFNIAVGIVERIDKLESTIFKLEEIRSKKSFNIVGFDEQKSQSFNAEGKYESEVILNDGELATEVFIQDILEQYINTLNLELEELRKNLDDI